MTRRATKFDDERRYRDEDRYTPNFATLPIEKDKRRVSNPYDDDDDDDDDRENAPTLSPARDWFQHGTGTGNRSASPEPLNSPSYSPRQLMPLDTYNDDVMEPESMRADSAMELSSLADSQRPTSMSSQMSASTATSGIRSSRRLEERSGSKRASQASTGNFRVPAADGLTGHMGPTKGIVDGLFAKKKTVNACEVGRAAWDLAEGPQFEEFITKKLPSSRVDVRGLKDYQRKLARLPTSSDVVVRHIQKLLREQADICTGLGVMVDGLMMRSEHLFHEVMVTRKRMLDEAEKKKLPQHCRGGLISKNLTRQWMLEECKPFKGRDLRKMLERWRPHCRSGDNNYFAHIVDFMRHYFSDACSPEDRIKKYSIRSHGNAGRSSSLQSVPEDLVQRLIDFTLDGLGLGHEDLMMPMTRVKRRASHFWTQLGDTDEDREEAFREMQNARVDCSALIRKALSRALTELRAYSFVAPGLPLAPKGNKKVVTLPS